MHVLEMVCAIAGGQWQGTRLVREVVSRSWALEDGLGAEGLQQHSLGLRSPQGSAHQIGAVDRHVLRWVCVCWGTGSCVWKMLGLEALSWFCKRF